MTNKLYRELEWLPTKPADFVERCKAVLEAEGDAGPALQSLAQCSLDANGLARLTNTSRKVAEQGRSLRPLVPLRLAILSNATTNLLAPALIATGMRHGLALEILETDFGQALQEALAPDSRVNQWRPDVVLLAIDHHGLPIRVTPGDAAAAQSTVDACLVHIDSIRSGLHAAGSGVCLVQTVPRPVEPLFGSADLALPGTNRHLIDAINRRLAGSIAGTADLLLDIAGLAETVGLADWHDPTMWNLAKLPFSAELIPIYAEQVCRSLAALRGKSRRVLILDLDNTVWGGVIGDDGVEGIIVGQGDGTGEAFLSVQQTALDLRQRGIVLAVSSKNTDEIARKPFREHPEMRLKEEHLAVFQANWNDKATNIKAIAEELALGLDAMVFLDDNPVERGLVRRLLPQVAVPELPDDPALYSRTLLAGGYFEASTFSAEDRQRADYYRDNARRVQLQQQAGDVDSYLVSLNMQIEFRPFDEIGAARITQLINKSNQYNLTTRRYSEAEVRAVQTDPSCTALQIRLVDAFGDNGMVSVVICRREAREWSIDTWLMSCRVLNRKVEVAVLMELLRLAKARGVKTIRGLYRPTERNALVKNHYASLGFESAASHPDGSTEWVLHVAAARLIEVPMEVRRSASLAET